MDVKITGALARDMALRAEAFMNECHGAEDGRFCEVHGVAHPAPSGRTTVSVGLRGNAGSGPRKAFLLSKGLKEGTPEFDAAMEGKKGTRISVAKTPGQVKSVEAEPPVPAMEKPAARLADFLAAEPRTNDPHMFQKASEVRAEINASRKFLKKLTPAQRDAVDSYVGPNTDTINECIQSGKGCTAALRKDTKLLKEVISQAPVRNHITFRGIDLRGAESTFDARVARLYKPGKEVSLTDGGFQSASTNVNVADGYAETKTSLIFQIAGRQKAAPVSGGMYEDESYFAEVVFDPSAKFKVVSVERAVPITVPEFLGSSKPSRYIMSKTIVTVEQILDPVGS